MPDYLRDLVDEFDIPNNANTNDEPMRRVDYKARKHGRPMPWLRGFVRGATEAAVLLAFVSAVGLWALGVAA